MVPRTTKAPLPDGAPTFETLAPMLPKERQVKAFHDPRFVHELKYDGYRVLAEFGRDGARLKSRNGANATRSVPEVTDALAAFGVGSARNVVDGEMCVLDELGRSDFDQLHARAVTQHKPAGAPPAVYCVFDVLVLNGEDVTARPLLERKEMLGQLFGQPPRSLLVVTYLAEENAGLALYDAVMQLKIEGLVAKRRDSLNRPAERTANWLQVKRLGAVPPGRFSRAEPDGGE